MTEPLSGFGGICRVQEAAYLGLAAAHAPRPCPAEPARLSVVLLSESFWPNYHCYIWRSHMSRAEKRFLCMRGCQKLVEGSATSCPTERPHTGHCLGISSSSSDCILQRKCNTSLKTALHQLHAFRAGRRVYSPSDVHSGSQVCHCRLWCNISEISRAGACASTRE